MNARFVDLDAMVDCASKLAPLPESLVRLAALICTHQYEVSDAAKLVAYDPILTLRLLRCANSARFSSSEKVSTVEEAVLKLGAAEVLAVAVAPHARRLMRGESSAYGLRDGELWNHSVATAVVTEVLSDHTPVRIPPETFTAALLHDVGKMVMNEFLDPEILEWFDRCRLEGSMNLLQAEREVLDVHHGEVGGIVAQRWRLPETIVRGIIYHHTPAECGDLICHAVAFSNEIARIVQERSSGQGFGTGLSSASLEVFQIDADNLELLVSDCRARFEEVSGRYNVQ